MDFPNRSIDKPANVKGNEIGWGSDAVAQVLRELDLEYITLNPGASYRGLHDSLVNHLGNRNPQMLLCLHEEHAVSIAHGYAKVAGRPLAVALHSNVGLMHGSMAIFNAFCDRVPMIILGGTGPTDAAKRRPWIDWIHTCRDQGGLVRDFVKWDDEPSSVDAAIEAIFRGNLIARTVPCGPVYIALDSAIQEQALETAPVIPSRTRHQPSAEIQPDPAAIAQVVDQLGQARKPVILAGRVSRSSDAWRARVALAERLGARVMTDMKTGAAFPTNHPLHVGDPVFFLSDEAKETLNAADFVLSLDWIDLSGSLKTARQDGCEAATVVSASLDHYSHNSWSMDYFGLPPVDIGLACTPDVATRCLLEALDRRGSDSPAGVAGWQDQELIDSEHVSSSDGSSDRDDAVVTLSDVAAALDKAVGGDDICLIRLPLGWPTSEWTFRHPLDYLGYDGGGGIGSGPGMAVGAALALRDNPQETRLPVAILGDGDCMMGITALWSAAHFGIPLLVIVANNGSYFNDELHQERVARERGRDPENRWIGQRIAGPDLDLAKMAEAQGFAGIGPVETVTDLPQAFEKGLNDVRNGGTCLIDVRVVPQYEGTMAAALTRKIETD